MACARQVPRVTLVMLAAFRLTIEDDIAGRSLAQKVHAESQESIPPCTFESCPRCLGGKASLSARNLMMRGSDQRFYERPFRIGRCLDGWDSMAISSQMIGILVRERLGVNVEYVLCDDGVQCYMAINNCAGWQAYECTFHAKASEVETEVRSGRKLFNDSLADIMFMPELAFEDVAVKNYEGTSLESTDWNNLKARELGPTGFTSQDGIWVYPDIVETAWDERHITLDTYHPYTTGEASHYLDAPEVLIEAGVQSVPAGCEGRSEYEEAAHDKHRRFGWICKTSEDGNSSWWVTPACAALGDAWKSRCVTIIDDDWGYTKPELYRALPQLHLLVAKVTVGYDPHWEMVYNRYFNATFFWWGPDATFRIHSPDRIGIASRLEAVNEVVMKIGWHGALTIDQRLSILLRRFTLKHYQMTELMQSIANAVEAGHEVGDAHGQHTYQKIACDWLRSHEHVWAEWVQNVFACQAGTFFNKSQGRCLPCPQGKYSFNHNIVISRCIDCPAGRAQPEPMSYECVSCTEGRYSYENASTACPFCPVGRFQQGSEKTACVACDSAERLTGSNTTTLWPASANSVKCVCPVGTSYRITDGRMQCTSCPQEGVWCPGGFSPLLAEFDDTPRVRTGYMSLPVDPYSIYACLDVVSCPGDRSLYTSDAMCASNVEPGPRCAICARGFYKATNGSCVLCQTEGSSYRVFLQISMYYGILCLVAGYFYFRRNRPANPAAIAAGLLWAFVQQVQVVIQLQLVWPNVLETIFRWIVNLSLQGLLEASPVKFECFQRRRLGFLVFEMLIMPLVFVSCFGFLWILAKCFHFRLIFNHVINSLALVWKGLFITVARRSLLPFIFVKMPNGVLMVKAFPDVARHSSEWFEILPITIVACLFYCVGFYAFLIHATISAPKWAASWPDFTVRYRFAFGPFRLDRWWWLVVQLTYQLCLVLVQSVSTSPHWQIYASTLVIMATVCLQFRVSPYRYASSNAVEGYLLGSLLIFLVLSSSFLKSRQRNDSTFTQTELNELLGYMCILCLISAVLFGIYQIGIWAWRQLRPAGVIFGKSATLAMRFREVSLSIAALSDREFLRIVGELSEIDLNMLQATLHTLITTFLKQQPDGKLWHQRVMPGSSFQIWDPTANSIKQMEDIVSGSLQEQVATNLRARLDLIMLAKYLKEQGEKPTFCETHEEDDPFAAFTCLISTASGKTLGDNSGNDDNDISGRFSFMHTASDKMRRVSNEYRNQILLKRGNSFTRLAHRMKLTSDDLGQEKFMEQLKHAAGQLHEGALERLHQLIDIDGDGRISLAEFTTAAISMARDTSTFSHTDWQVVEKAAKELCEKFDKRHGWLDAQQKQSAQDHQCERDHHAERKKVACTMAAEDGECDSLKENPSSEFVSFEVEARNDHRENNSLRTRGNGHHLVQL